MSKHRFKALVNREVNLKALNHLNQLAESHTKSTGLIKNQISCEKYLTDSRFSPQLSQLLFALRTCTVKNIKANASSACPFKTHCKKTVQFKLSQPLTLAMC